MFTKVPNPISPKGIKPAKQEFKQDADINSIMAKFQKTGAIDHVSKHQQNYGIATPQSLHEALNVVTAAQTMFNDLPSSLRNKFENRASDFLKFVQDEKNYEEAIELGLDLTPEASQAAHERLEREKVAKAAEAANVAPGEPQAAPAE